INDRGPFIRGRVIDLSVAAARVIGMLNSGVAPVNVQVLDN
ncbi:MAG: septal ring lytic transglycosylase RlpA family protein, partial [Symploca sp. SIO2G7]|nr:septal ring lytic transglycosylase RlpA family protein [Symploca sp. SIO2G7]